MALGPLNIPSWHVNLDGESHQALPQDEELQAVKGFWEGESVLSWEKPTDGLLKF